METLVFIQQNLPVIYDRTIEHISIVGVAVLMAILAGVPIGGDPLCRTRLARHSAPRP